MFHTCSAVPDQAISQNTGVEGLVRRQYVDIAGTSGLFVVSLKFPATTDIHNGCG